MANLPIGVAMNPRIINRELLADIVMGDSPEADRVYADIQNGVINNLSIGYSIDDAEEDDLGNRVITRFTPHEVSFVSVPADPRAVVTARTNEMTELETRSQRISAKNKTMSEDHRAMIDLGKRYDCLDEALECIDEGTSVDAFRTEVMKREADKTKAMAA